LERQAGQAYDEETSLYDGDEPLREEDSSVAQIFMRERCHVHPLESSEQHQKQAEDVEIYCRHITLEHIQELNETFQDLEPLAMLDQRSQTGKYRTNRGPMNA
jgi:hypothetical protein